MKDIQGLGRSTAERIPPHGFTRWTGARDKWLDRHTSAAEGKRRPARQILQHIIHPRGQTWHCGMKSFINNDNGTARFEMWSVCVLVSRHRCPDNLCRRLMAALQAQTKLSSDDPGVCPSDLRGAATANKTHKDSGPWHRPSPRLHAILPLLHTAAYCFVSGPRPGSSSHLTCVVFQGSPAARHDDVWCVLNLLNLSKTGTSLRPQLHHTSQLCPPATVQHLLPMHY